MFTEMVDQEEKRPGIDCQQLQVLLKAVFEKRSGQDKSRGIHPQTRLAINQRGQCDEEVLVYEVHLSGFDLYLKRLAMLASQHFESVYLHATSARFKPSLAG